MLFALAFVLTAVEVILQFFDPIGRHHEVEHLRYRNEALRYAWSNLPPARFSAIDLDGTLYRQKPSLDLDLGSYRLRTNRLGFRGPEIEREKPEGTFRILILGDSVCYGTGVNDEVTFVRRWEADLNRRGSRRFEVVNTGHPMYDTNQELAVLKDAGLALQPDLVLLVYVVNDIEPTRDVVEQALLGLLALAAGEVEPKYVRISRSTTAEPSTPPNPTTRLGRCRTRHDASWTSRSTRPAPTRRSSHKSTVAQRSTDSCRSV